MIYKKNNLYCNKCKSYIDIENIEDYEVDWFEYGSYSQKKLKCKECGNWITITTKEDIIQMIIITKIMIMIIITKIMSIIKVISI